MSISTEKILATGKAFAAVCTKLATNAGFALRLGVKIGRLGDDRRPDLLASAIQPIVAEAIKAVDQHEHLTEQGVNLDLLGHLVIEAMTTDGTVTPEPTASRSTTTVHNDDDWTDEEDAVVRDLLVSGERLRTIAVNVGRSPGAVRARLRRLYGTSDVAILRRRVRR